MLLTQALLGEIEHEIANTKKMFEALPDDRFDWKPHDKSCSLGHLASHVAEIVGWAAGVAGSEGFDMTGYETNFAKDRQELLAILDKNAQMVLNVLGSAPDDFDWNKTWTLRQGDQVLFAMPRAVTIRGMVLNHLYHHRGQLAVYLRLLNKPVPGMYGPSADEMETMPQTA